MFISNPDFVFAALYKEPRFAAVSLLLSLGTFWGVDQRLPETTAVPRAA